MGQTTALSAHALWLTVNYSQLSIGWWWAFVWGFFRKKAESVKDASGLDGNIAQLCQNSGKPENMLQKTQLISGVTYEEVRCINWEKRRKRRT